MAGIKPGKLPDRTPVKVTFNASPALKQALDDYAVLYEVTYGRREPISDLVPAMLAAFLEGDRAFARDRKGAK